MKKVTNVQIKIVAETKQAVQTTLDILQSVFSMNVSSKIMQNDQDFGYHCLMTVNPLQSTVQVKK
jgi:hypothetical protein